MAFCKWTAGMPEGQPCCHNRAAATPLGHLAHTIVFVRRSACKAVGPTVPAQVNVGSRHLQEQQQQLTGSARRWAGRRGRHWCHGRGTPGAGQSAPRLHGRSGQVGCMMCAASCMGSAARRPDMEAFQELSHIHLFIQAVIPCAQTATASDPLLKSNQAPAPMR